MLHVKEKFLDESTVKIQIDCILDMQNLEPIKRLFTRHINNGKKIIFFLDGLLSVNKEGRNFFNQIKKQVSFSGMSSFLKLSLEDPKDINYKEKL